MREAAKRYYAEIMMPFRAAIRKATIENLGDPRICDGCGRFNEECSCG